MWVFLLVPFDWNGNADMERAEAFRTRETAERVRDERNAHLASLNDFKRELDRNFELFALVTED